MFPKQSLLARCPRNPRCVERPLLARYPRNPRSVERSFLARYPRNPRSVEREKIRVWKLAESHRFLKKKPLEMALAIITKIEALQEGQICSIRGKVTYKSDSLISKSNPGYRFEFSLYDGRYLRCVYFSKTATHTYKSLFKFIQAGKYYTIRDTRVKINDKYGHFQLILDQNSNIIVEDESDELNISPHADLIKISDVMGLNFGNPSSRIISTAGRITYIHEPVMRNGGEEQVRKIDITDGKNKVSVAIWDNDLCSNKIFNKRDFVVVENCLLNKYNDELEVMVDERHSELTTNPDWINETDFCNEEHKKETYSSATSHKDIMSYLKDAREELQDVENKITPLEDKQKKLSLQIQKLDYNRKRLRLEIKTLENFKKSKQL
ncbi:hypothetical protein V9T40_003610 [Parthenolecanium corni]|uniref:Uncharacterized protein n=1 Tax=Parthenolecanium corni TaxID=536013 RepID=A0AAN9TSZ8_9HEMI